MNNAFFKTTDQKLSSIGGGPIPDGWWSRGYEYPWAGKFAEPGHIVADMGAGWHERPFKHFLAEVCGEVYAVDIHPEFPKLNDERPFPSNLKAIVADMCTVELPPLDVIFCISVFEDLGDVKLRALQNFYKLLKPGGKVVMTFDTQYDFKKPLGKYPGVGMKEFVETAVAAGFPIHEINADKENLVFHEGFNLCVFHTVLVKPE